MGFELHKIERIHLLNATLYKHCEDVKTNGDLACDFVLLCFVSLSIGI